jgi:phosphopantetheinyl transferase (holo-ACP synthase)
MTCATVEGTAAGWGGIGIGISALAEPRTGYWIVRDLSGRVAGSEQVLATYLGAEERAELLDLRPPARPARVLGRIAAKDAVRRWLADRGTAVGAPRSVRILNDTRGRPRVVVEGREPVRISLAHCRSVAVAAVAPVHAGVDVEVVEARGTVFARLALTGRELGLGEALDLDEWVTRAWTIKEALAKAAGTGLGGRPKDFVVHELDGDWAWASGRWVHTTREGDMVVSTVRERCSGDA